MGQYFFELGDLLLLVNIIIIFAAGCVIITSDCADL